MNTNKSKRVLASTKINELAVEKAKEAGRETGTSKGSLFRIILEDVITKATPGQLRGLIYGEIVLKIEESSK